MAGRITAILTVIAIVGLIRFAGLELHVTQGTSMAPRFDAGDLAVTVVSGRYQVGDVVAYHSGMLDTTVLHRIVEAHGDWFVTKGDNNAWADPDHPGPADIRGRLLVRIPALGRLLAPAGVSPTLGGYPLAAVATGLLVFAGTSALFHRARRRGRFRLATPPGAHRRRSRLGNGRTLAGVLAGVSVLAVAAVWLLPRPAAPVAAPAAVSPSSAAGAAGTEELRVGYTAQTRAVATYPDGRVGTGDPIFVNAVRTLTVAGTYTGTRDVTTTVEAELAHPTGWRRALPLDTSTSKQTRTGAAATATLDVRDITDLLQHFAAETGLPAPGATLALTAKAGSWSMRSELTYDGVQFQARDATFTATREAASSTPQADPSARAADATSPRSAPVAQLTATTPRRTATTVGLLVLIAAGGWGARAKGRAGQRLPADRLIPVATYLPAEGRSIVDVAGAEDLSRIARRTDRPILHVTTSETRTYLLDDGTVVYRLRDSPVAP